MKLNVLSIASLLIVAAPLSAQNVQTTLVPDVVVNGDTIVVNVDVMPDTLRDRLIAEAIQSLTAQLAEQGCDQCGGTSTVVQVSQAALVVAAFFIGWQLKKLNTNIEEIADNIPSHEHDDDYGEGDQSR